MGVDRFSAGANVEDSWGRFIDRFFPLPSNVGVVVAFILFSISVTALVDKRPPFEGIVWSSDVVEELTNDGESDVGLEGEVGSFLSETECCAGLVSCCRVADRSSGQSCVSSSSV